MDRALNREARALSREARALNREARALNSKSFYGNLIDSLDSKQNLVKSIGIFYFKQS